MDEKKKVFRVTVSIDLYEDMRRVQEEVGEVGIQALTKLAVQQYITRHDSRAKK